jgi:3-deoxy-7-phosphoheptulonate synthase
MLGVVELGLPVGTEFLDTTLGQYYADLVSWGAIGARTVESQVHRELASGLSMPVGFKNRTDGNLQVAIDAIRSARQPHWFPSLTREGAPAVLGTTGNEHTHLVLRGGTSGPNHHPAAVGEVVALLAKNGVPGRLVIDCSHANSGKDPARQPAVAAEIAAHIADGERAIAGVMLESHLLGGTQDFQAKPLVYGRVPVVGADAAGAWCAGGCGETRPLRWSSLSPGCLILGSADVLVRISNRADGDVRAPREEADLHPASRFATVAPCPRNPFPAPPAKS